MREKALKVGGTAYYWSPPTVYVKAGFTIGSEALGVDYATAAARADELNRHLDSWRDGRGATRELDLQPGFGTIEWLVERYKRSRAWEKVSSRSRPEYERAFKLVLHYKLKTGQELRLAPVHAMSARGVDQLYDSLKKGRSGTRLRTANVCMLRMAKAWDAVRRLFPKSVPAENPFRGVDLEHGKRTTRPATRDEAYALHRALVAAGEPHLAIAPLVAFEWHQRPENVIAGHLTWPDYRPSERPNAVQIVHHKTGALMWHPLNDSDGKPFYPELTAYLDALPRLGVPIVLMRPKSKGAPAKPFLMREARKRVRLAARAAGLPDDLTLAACRHGGMTELGDAGLTEQGVMALSGHKTPTAARIYVKRTENQRLAATRKRRAWVDSIQEAEQKEGVFRNEPPASVSE